MIFETEVAKEVKQTGDIKNNNVSIDTNNIDFIVTILSTNLYSKPIESFIRETVSNAWDSHVEAGVDTPVILELFEDSEKVKYCRIQDFGVGLSPERFNKIYKNIGSSSKRTDNKQIGGFGIGRFSALAYSDVVHITTVHEKKKYLYMMYKDGNSISIDLLHEEDTDEKNGLEVKLEIKPTDTLNFVNAIKSQLVYFENLYVNSKLEVFEGHYSDREVDIEKQYNSFNIKKYKNFWVNNLDDNKEINLVLGKVRYPLRINSLDKHYSQKVEAYPISLKFDIGDLDVTPNREEILYSEKNKKIIEAKLDLAIEEVDELVLNLKAENYDKISDYVYAIQLNDYLTLLDSEEGEKVRIKVKNMQRKITLNNEFYDLDSFAHIYSNVMGGAHFAPAYTLQNGSLRFNGGHNLHITYLKDNFSKHYISEISNLSGMAKRYLREEYVDGCVFLQNSKSTRYYIKDVIKHIQRRIEQHNKYRNHKSQAVKYNSKIAKVVIKHVFRNISKIKTFSNSDVPQSWIDKTKAADKAKRSLNKTQGFDWSQNVNLHLLRRKSGGGLMTDSKTIKLDELSKYFKSLVIYGDKEDRKLRDLYNYWDKYNSIRQDRVTFVEVAKTKKKLLANVNNFVEIKDFMDVKYKLIRNIGTSYLLEKEIPHLKSLARISNLNEISKSLAKAVHTLFTFKERYTSSGYFMEEGIQEEIYELCVEKDYFNEEIRAVYNNNKKELKNAQILTYMHAGSLYGGHTKVQGEALNFIVDYLLTRKLIKPNVEAIKKLKLETIFNVKIEEDENNEN